MRVDSAIEPLHAGLGVLEDQISPDLVDAVIDAAGRRERRRRMLPARVVVYLVLGLCLFANTDSVAPPGYRSVMRTLASSVRHLRQLVVPTSSALSRARKRLGAEPLRLLFDRVRGPLASAATPGAFWHGLRLVAWDGTVLDVADSAANRAEFTHSAYGPGPQLRLLALIECGTRAVISAVFGSAGQNATGKVASEHQLARQALGALSTGMLLLADRNFAGHDLWAQVTATGAELLWRVQRTLALDPVELLPDGSHIAVLASAADKALHRRKKMTTPLRGHRVRVIEYTVTVRYDDGRTRTEDFRLITTLLDHERYPAAQLATLYHERWESETSYLELKTRVRGSGFILRSKTPELVRQEIYAMLIIYQAITRLRVDAATTGGTDPDRISFTVTIRAARDHITHRHRTMDQLRRTVISDILAEQLPARRNRHYPRRRRLTQLQGTPRHDTTRPAGRVDYKISISQRHTSHDHAPSP